MRAQTRIRYFQIFAAHVLGQHAEEIAADLGVSRRTIFTAIRWVSENRLKLEPKAKLDLAITERRAHLHHLASRRGVLEEQKAWNAWVGVERLIAQIHSEIAELEGLKTLMVEASEPDDLTVDISIKGCESPDGYCRLEAWERRRNERNPVTAKDANSDTAVD
jgi:hypothetical protein